jgi:hypothetical protein
VKEHLEETVVHIEGTKTLLMVWLYCFYQRPARAALEIKEGEKENPVPYPSVNLGASKKLSR